MLSFVPTRIQTDTIPHRLEQEQKSGEFSWVEPSMHGSGADKPSPRNHYAITYVPSTKRGSEEGYALLVGGMTPKGLCNETYQMSAGRTVTWKSMVQHGHIPEPCRGHSATYVEWKDRKNRETDSEGPV